MLRSKKSNDIQP